METEALAELEALLPDEAEAPPRARPRFAPVRWAAFELAPVWWVARAYVAGAGIALAVSLPWSIAHPVVPRIGTPAVTAAAFLGLLAGSTALGLAPRRGALRGRLRGVLAALNVVLALAAAPVAAHALAQRAPVRSVTVVQEVTPIGQELSYDSILIRNVYPYTRDGRPLHDVLLYDEFGRPLDLGSPALDPDRRLLVARRGGPLLNSFPIRYYEPGTRVVAHPNAGYVVRPPRLKPSP